MQKHKILSFSLALLVSIGLWFYAVTVVNPDDTATIRGVRVRLVGMSDLQSSNLMLTGGEEQTITVEVSGRRSNLKELNSSSLEATADVSNIDTPGEHQVSWTLNPPSSVASGDISLVGASSRTVTVKVSEYTELPEVPISVEYVGDPAENYLRDTTEILTESFSVSGPAEELANIARAVVTVDLTNATETISGDMAYRFVDADGNELTLSNYVTVSAESIRVSVRVVRYKQISLKVNVTAGGGATENEAICVIDPPAIVVTGTEEVLEALDELVIAEIDLADETRARTWTVTPNLPAGVTNRATDPTVSISLSFTGLITRNFSISCTQIERLNDVERLSFAEQSVVISVRGRASVVNALTAETIRLSADMTTDYDSSTKLLTLTVSLPTGSSAGVVNGPYTVQMVETTDEES